MKTKTLSPKESILSPTTYSGFHLLLKGRDLKMKDGTIRTKLSVFLEYETRPGVLRDIAYGRHSEIKLVDKPGWRDGLLIDTRSYYRDADYNLSLK